MIQTQYKDLAATALERGGSATIGIENAWGDVAIQHSYNQAAMGGPTYAVRYYKPGTAVVSGVVTDANTGKPVAGAFVTVFQNGAQVASSSTSQAGGYAFQLPLGSYTLEFAAYNYPQQVAAVVLDTEYGVVAQDIALISGLPVLSNWNFA